MDVKRRDVLKGAAATTAAAAVSSAAIIAPTPSYAQQLDAAKVWVDNEFQPSSMSKDQQMAEMEWFIKASAPFKGMEVSTVSEILSVHDYEAKILTKAFADITGIKALKRRIEKRSEREGADDRNVKTGRGGIRDIEFAIQFLQLLNGGDLPALRTSNTLDAIARLEDAGCLTHQERTILEENYSFLRKIEHRLQIMFDLQTHTMPESPEELRRLAIRMGYGGRPHRAAPQIRKTPPSCG